MSYQTKKEELLRGFGVHQCLKDTIRLFDGKDPCDAAMNAEILQELMQLRVDEMLAQYPPSNSRDYEGSRVAPRGWTEVD